MRHADCTDTFEAMGDQMAGPGGFETRILAALAHLREAWCSADSGNKVAVTAAMRVLVSRCEHKRLAQAICYYALGPEQGEKLWQEVKP